MAIKLWGRPTSARTQKVMLALAELNLEYEYILASATMGRKGSVAKGGQPFGVVDTPEYILMNPTKTIPTICDDGYVLWESNAIVQYLGMRYNPHLFYRNDTLLCNSALRWMMWENNRLIGPMHDIVEQRFRVPAADRNPQLENDAEQKLNQEFEVIENQLEKTEFIAGSSWSMGDIPISIRCHRFFLLDIKTKPMPQLARYYETLKARPSFKVIEDETLHISG
ncbi:MAG: glutathione S-transferase family protein [Rhodospirillaceae bacterium]|nr:glutathione S-transferase family protein [Rhodospirillaceae bacterium]